MHRFQDTVFFLRNNEILFLHNCFLLTCNYKTFSNFTPTHGYINLYLINISILTIRIQARNFYEVIS